MEEIFKRTKQFKQEVFDKVKLEFHQFGLHIYNANVKQLVDVPGYEYFSYLGQKTQMEAANQAKIDVSDAKMKGAIGAKEREGLTLQNTINIDAELKIISTRRQGEGNKEEIRVKTKMQIYKNQRDAKMEQVNAELAKKKAVWSQSAKMAQVEADKGSNTRNFVWWEGAEYYWWSRHAQGSVGEGGGKEAVLYDKIRESASRSRARRQEELTELRKRADEFLCMFNEVQNESKDRLKEIEESQLKLAQLQTTLERLELNVSNLESEN
ncbi:hypothetical protein AgCh_000636 [Apium graveolens]